MMQILSSDGTPKVFVEGHGLFIEFYHPVTYMQSFPTILNSYGKQKIVWDARGFKSDWKSTCISKGN